MQGSGIGARDGSKLYRGNTSYKAELDRKGISRQVIEDTSSESNVTSIPSCLHGQHSEEHPKGKHIPSKQLVIWDESVKHDQIQLRSQGECSSTTHTG